MKTEKPTLAYDECDLIEEEVKYQFEENNEEGRTEEEIYNSLDYYFLNDCWEDFKNCLTEVMTEINKNHYWKVKGVNMGWRNLEGNKTFKAINGEEMLKKILPNTSEFTLYIWKTKTQIKIRCSHHDSPIGEYYYIKSLNKKELKAFEEEFY